MLLLCACSRLTPYDKGEAESYPVFSSSFPNSTQDNQITDSQNESPSPVPTPKLYTYEVSTNIHETMPEYRFVAAGEDIFVTSVNVYNENDASILSISFEPESCPVYPEMMDTMGLHISDVNFDGYKDVIILNCFHGAHGNSWYDCWLWNEKASAFIHSESFVNICNPALDPIEQCIYSTGGSGAGYQSWHIYKFIDGVFTVSNSLSFEVMYDDMSGNYLGIQVKEEALIDGKMDIVNNEIIHGNVSFNETSYSNNELWQLDNPRWYGVGGHHADKWLE